MRSQLPQILLQAFEADNLFRAATTVSGEVEGFGAIGKCQVEALQYQIYGGMVLQSLSGEPCAAVRATDDALNQDLLREMDLFGGVGEGHGENKGDQEERES